MTYRGCICIRPGPGSIGCVHQLPGSTVQVHSLLTQVGFVVPARQSDRAAARNGHDGRERSDVESRRPVAQALADAHVLPHPDTERGDSVLADDGHHIHR